MPGDSQRALSSGLQKEEKHLHGSLAAGTGERSSWYRFQALKLDMQDKLNEKKELFGLAMEKSIIPDPSKALWQHMLKDKMKKILTLQCPLLNIPRVFGVPEGYHPIFTGNNIFFRYHSPVEIA